MLGNGSGGEQPKAIPPTREDHRTRFYQVYRSEADEYDREFVKRYEEDLNTTLVFVSFFYISRVWWMR